MTEDWTKMPIKWRNSYHKSIPLCDIFLHETRFAEYKMTLLIDHVFEWNDIPIRTSKLGEAKRIAESQARAALITLKERLNNAK